MSGAHATGSDPRLAVRRAGGLALVSALALGALVPVVATLPRSLPALVAWWSAAEPARRLTGVVALVGVVVALRLFVAAVAVLVLCVGSLSPRRRPSRLVRRLVPRALRVWLAVGVVATAWTPALADAGEGVPAPRSITAHDLGPAVPADLPNPGVEASEVPVARDLGPASDPVLPGPADPDRGVSGAGDPVASSAAGEATGDPAAGSAGRTRDAATDAATWTIRPGEHVWAVARAVASRHDPDPVTSTVARYWRALLEANADRLGPDPDLVRPGLRLVLPAWEAVMTQGR